MKNRNQRKLLGKPRQMNRKMKTKSQKKLKMNTCQLALSGYNLLTFTPYLWGDPETRASNAPSYPLARTYTLSLKLGF